MNSKDVRNQWEVLVCGWVAEHGSSAKRKELGERYLRLTAKVSRLPAKARRELTLRALCAVFEQRRESMAAVIAVARAELSGKSPASGTWEAVCAAGDQDGDKILDHVLSDAEATVAAFSMKERIV